uniref:7TM_GPCR_Srx domain-containing protein n=1 Tax=Heterorhabditis bacteriophora TaxID=37862 RepID=A0A1I7WTH9_HETBA
MLFSQIFINGEFRFYWLVFFSVFFSVFLGLSRAGALFQCSNEPRHLPLGSSPISLLGDVVYTILLYIDRTLATFRLRSPKLGRILPQRVKGYRCDISLNKKCSVVNSTVLLYFLSYLQILRFYYYFDIMTVCVYLHLVIFLNEVRHYSDGVADLCCKIGLLLFIDLQLNLDHVSAFLIFRIRQILPWCAVLLVNMNLVELNGVCIKTVYKFLVYEIYFLAFVIFGNKNTNRGNTLSTKSFTLMGLTSGEKIYETSSISLQKTTKGNVL